MPKRWCWSREGEKLLLGCVLAQRRLPVSLCHSTLFVNGQWIVGRFAMLPHLRLLVGLFVGTLAANADFLYTFEQTGTSNSFSFTVPSLLTGTTDPLTPAIGLSVGGFTISDAFFGPLGSGFCASFSGSSTTDAFNCGITTNVGGLTGGFGTFLNPTSVGVYTMSGGAAGGFPNLNRLTISQVPAAVPEPTSLVLLGTLVAGVGWRLGRKRLSC